MGNDNSEYSYSGTEELYAIENQLKIYNKDIALKLSRYVCKKNEKILEYGAGIGTITRLFASITGIKPDCLEIDKSLKSVLIDRGFNVFGSINELTKKYNIIYFSNVLEHIEDDVGELKLLHDYLEDHGLLLVYVPAYMMLYSEFDASVGHYRRYSKKNLKKVIQDANFEVIGFQFVDCLGFFVWFLLKLRFFSGYHKFHITKCRI